MDTADKKHVGGGGSRPGKFVKVEAYDGWLVRFLSGKQNFLVEELNGENAGKVERLRGWNTVPMEVTMPWCKPEITHTCCWYCWLQGTLWQEWQGTNPLRWSQSHVGHATLPRLKTSRPLAPLWACSLPLVSFNGHLCFVELLCVMGWKPRRKGPSREAHLFLHESSIFYGETSMKYLKESTFQLDLYEIPVSKCSLKRLLA